VLIGAGLSGFSSGFLRVHCGQDFLFSDNAMSAIANLATYGNISRKLREGARTKSDSRFFAWIRG
jgi:tetrahydromethanopterin S-methyltransferase subunit E